MNHKAMALEGCMVEDDLLYAAVQQQLEQPFTPEMIMPRHEMIQKAVEKRLAHMAQGNTIETVKYITSDEADADALHQAATDRAVDGDYLGAIICEEAAKLAK